MPAMTDPINALIKFQAALDDRRVFLQPCEIHRGLKVYSDRPEGKLRITYVKVKGRIVQAIALLALAEPVERIPCFQLGYAVIEPMRGRGLGLQVVTQGIDEFRNGVMRNGLDCFYLEAIVSQSNVPSNKIASRLLSDTPTTCTDEFSGEPVLQYLKKIVC